MFWLYLTLIVIVGLALGSFLLWAFIRWLARREPYGTFIRLRTRRKLTFFRLLMQDKRVPVYVIAIPVVLVMYLSLPFDIIPDFVPVLGYLDDVAIALLALVLVLRFTPWPVVLDLLNQASESAGPPVT